MPAGDGDAVKLSSRELALLLKGIDLAETHAEALPRRLRSMKDWAAASRTGDDSNLPTRPKGSPMIVAQEQAFLKAQSQLQAIEQFVEAAAESGQRIDRVERDLFGRLLALGHTLLSALVAAAGEGDAGTTLEASDGRTVRRQKGRRIRRYLSIFGELSIERYVYAARDGQKIERRTGTGRRRQISWRRATNSVCPREKVSAKSFSGQRLRGGAWI